MTNNGLKLNCKNESKEKQEGELEGGVDNINTEHSPEFVEPSCDWLLRLWESPLETAQLLFPFTDMSCHISKWVHQR